MCREVLLRCVLYPAETPVFPDVSERAHYVAMDLLSVAARIPGLRWWMMKMVETKSREGEICCWTDLSQYGRIGCRF